MATRAVTEFFNKAETDPVLAERIAAAPATDKRSWAAEIARIAQRSGYGFDPDEIDAAVAEQNALPRELGEDQLSAVSGGATAFGVAQVAPSFYEAWPSKWYVPKT